MLLKVFSQLYHSWVGRSTRNRLSTTDGLTSRPLVLLLVNEGGRGGGMWDFMGPCKTWNRIWNSGIIIAHAQ